MRGGSKNQAGYGAEFKAAHFGEDIEPVLWIGLIHA